MSGSIRDGREVGNKCLRAPSTQEMAVHAVGWLGKMLRGRNVAFRSRVSVNDSGVCPLLVKAVIAARRQGRAHMSATLQQSGGAEIQVGASEARQHLALFDISPQCNKSTVVDHEAEFLFRHHSDLSCSQRISNYPSKRNQINNRLWGCEHFGWQGDR